MLNDPESSTAALPEFPQAVLPQVPMMATATKTKSSGAAAKPKRKKKKQPRSSKTGGGNLGPEPESGLVERLRRQLFRPKVLVALAAIIAATTIVPQLMRQIPDPAERSEYQLTLDEIEITKIPRHVPVDLVDQVAQRAKLPRNLSLLDDDLVQRVADAFGKHPWVAEVVQVRKSFPARIEVELKYRKPAAMVAVPDGLYPIDAEGILLPPIDFSVADTRLYPVIRGVLSSPPGAEGTRWRDPAVLGAAQLAELLGAKWKDLSLDAIHLPRYQRSQTKTDELTFDLQTRGGSRILWGRAPSTDHPGELTPEQKIGRLEKYLADFGSFDAPHGPYEIDIRHWQEISRRPLSANRDMSARR